MTTGEDASVKKMAELLRQGATLLAQACPQCGSPLLKVGEDIYCATCDRRIVIVKSDDEVDAQAVKLMLPKLHETLLNKLKFLNEVIEREDNVEELTKLANLMILLLQAIERLHGLSENE
ncbi:MAG: hypothetical protein JSW61_00125 [Candidatus Thorarchaeota archaeon]|nr:MAG: hypothetical protein JSW61_00125 [Candidatus Thorarchaeota archaeon]